MAFLLFSCSPKVVDNVPQKNMINQMNNIYSNNSLDSMCIVDTLPNLENWEKLYLKEFETKEKTIIFLYTKNTTTYKVEKINNDSVKIIKRIIK